MRQPLLRSYLYITATKPELFQKALLSEADAIIIDLEDGVAYNRKKEARHNVVEYLSSKHNKPIFVRVNPLCSEFSQDDIIAIAPLQPTGIRIPKVNTPQQVSTACDVLRKLKFEGSLQLQIESSVGVLNMDAIAQADPMISVMSIGEEDLRADLRCERYMLQSILFKLVITSKAANLLPPVASVYPNLTEVNEFVESTKWAKKAGFFGRITVHPCQLPTINGIFTPTFQEIDYAQHVITKLNETFINGQTTTRDNMGNYISIWTKRHA